MHGPRLYTFISDSVALSRASCSFRDLKSFIYPRAASHPCMYNSNSVHTRTNSIPDTSGGKDRAGGPCVLIRLFSFSSVVAAGCDSFERDPPTGIFLLRPRRTFEGRNLRNAKTLRNRGNFIPHVVYDPADTKFDYSVKISSSLLSAQQPPAETVYHAVAILLKFFF